MAGPVLTPEGGTIRVYDEDADQEQLASMGVPPMSAPPEFVPSANVSAPSGEELAALTAPVTPGPGYQSPGYAGTAAKGGMGGAEKTARAGVVGQAEAKGWIAPKAGAPPAEQAPPQPQRQAVAGRGVGGPMPAATPKWLERIGGSVEMPGQHNMDLVDERLSELERKRLAGEATPQDAAEDAEIRRWTSEDPNALAWQQQRLQMRGDIVKARQEAQQRKIEAAEMETLAGHAEQAQQFERDEMTRANIRLAEQKEAEAEIDRKIAEADEEVKAHRIKGDRRGIGRLLFDNLSIALSAMGPRPRVEAVAEATRQIEKRLDRDLDVQRAELDRKAGKAKSARNDLSIYQKKFEDGEQASAALRGHYYREQAQAARQVALRATTQKARAGLEGLAANLEQRAAEVEGGLRLSAAQLRAQQKAAMMRGGPAKQRSGANADEPFVRGYIDDKKASLYSAEAGGFFPSDTARNSYIDKTTRIDAAVASMDELVALANNPSTAWTPELRGKAEAALRQAMTTTTVANEQGAMSEGDAAHIKGQLGDIGAIADTRTLTNKIAAIKQTRGLLLQARENYKGVVGVERGQRYAYKDEKSGEIRYEAVVENPAYSQRQKSEKEDAEAQAALEGLRE